MNDWREFLFWWTASLLAAATIVGGRLGMALFRMAPDPPEDVKLAAHWARRRRWLAFSEILALPSFATVAVSAVAYWKLDPIVAVLLAMFLGGVGFALLLDGLYVEAGFFIKIFALQQICKSQNGIHGCTNLMAHVG